MGTMRISKIGINGFGKFNDISFDLSGPITCFTGYNEAGKSTVMGFIRSILFGFPTRTYMKERYEPLHGGLHGGIISLTDEQGHHFRIERYDGGTPASNRGKQAGHKIKITLEDGSTVGEDYLHRLLGGVTSDVFRNLFAFSLSELQEISTLQSDEISGYLFNAGVGAGAGTILEAEKRIVQEMDQLFKPKGRNQEIQQILKALEETRIELQLNKESVSRFNQRMDELTQSKELLLQLESQLDAIKFDANWIDKCLKTRGRWIELVEFRKELDELPSFHGFPEDALSRYEKLAAEKESLALNAQRKQAKIEELAIRISNMDINEEFLAKTTAIDSKLERLRSYQDAKVSVIELGIEIQNIVDELNRLLRKINRAWSYDDLRAFSTSVSEREKVHGFRERLAACKEETDLLDHELERLIQQESMDTKQLVEMKTLLRKLELYQEQNFGWMKRIEWTDFQSLLSELRREYEQWKQMKIDIRHKQERYDDLLQAREALQQFSPNAIPSAMQSFPGYLWVTLGLNAVIPIYLFIENQTAEAVLSLAIFSAFHIYLFLKKGRPSKISDLQQSAAKGLVEQHQQRISALQQSIDEANEELNRKTAYVQALLIELIDDRDAATAALSPGSVLSSAAYVDFSTPFELTDEIIVELDRIAEMLQRNELERHQLDLRAQQQSRVIQALSEQKKQMKHKLQKASDSSDVAYREWQDWLSESHLEAQLSPETVLEIFQIAEQGLQLLSQKEKYELKLKSLQVHIENFEGETRALLSLSDEAEIEISLRQYKHEIDQQRAKLEEKNSLEKQVIELKEEHDTICVTLEQLEQKIRLLWHEANAENEEQFRLHTRYHERRLKLQEEVRHAEVFLETWVGKDRREHLDKQLQEKDLDQLNLEAQHLDSTISALNDQINTLREQRGRLYSEMEQLKSGRDYTEKLQLHEEQLASFQQVAGQWAVRAFCLKLFNKAKEVYEREKQPGVLRKASDYFALITDQQFTRVMAPIGEKRIMVERANGEVVDTAFMSRGTAEQLYLAMRFALADEYTSKVSLPIVMDDIFVNFDAVRLQNTLRLLKNVCERQQIILFTCHPQVSEALASVIPEHQSIDLNR